MGSGDGVATAATLPARAVRNERRKLLFVGCMLVVCFSVMTLAMSVGAHEELSRTARTTATVSGGESVSNEGTQVCKYADVQISVDGVDYYGRQSVGGTCPDDGGPSRTTVRYDPEDPSSFDDGEVDWGVFVFLAVSVIGLLSGVYLVGRQLWLRVAAPVVEESDGEFSIYRRDPSRGPRATVDFTPALLPPGVTAYVVPRHETLRPVSPGAAPFGAAVTCGLALLPLLDGVPLVTLVVALLAGALPTALTFRLRLIGRYCALVLVGVTGAIVLATVSGGWSVVAFLLGMGAGFLASLPLSSRHGLRRRLRTAVGAPGRVVEPRGGRDVGTLATWRDPSFEYEAIDPDPEVVLDACRRLDGDAHAYVAIYRGAGRLDVSGRDDLTLAVHQSDQRSSGQWQVVGDRNRPPTWTQAERAVRTWLSHGRRDPALAWSAVARDGAPPRPPQLAETD